MPAPRFAAFARGYQLVGVVLALGDQKVSTVEDLLAALRRHEPGERVSLTRDGETVKFDVTLNGRSFG